MAPALQPASNGDPMKSRWAAEWREALLLPGEDDLIESSLRELSEYFGITGKAARDLCENALADSRSEWLSAPRQTPAQIRDFYRHTQSYIYEHIWWHAADLETNSINVAILDYAKNSGASCFLDFGSGVGSTGILFARHGFSVTIADISSTMLDFARWRFERRGLKAEFLDLNENPLPRRYFDMITATDVFEHLVDPAAEMKELSLAMKDGGRLIFNYQAGIDDQRPMHLMKDDSVIRRSLRESGLRRVRDKADWLARFDFHVVGKNQGNSIYNLIEDAIDRNSSRRLRGSAQPQHPQKTYLNRLRDRLRGDSRWLDLGCGRGAVPWWLRGKLELEEDLKSLSGLIVGVDGDREALLENDFCHERILAGAGRLPFTDGSFDLVTSNMVFEHLPDPGPVLAEIARVLRPGGVLLAITPNSLDIVSIAARAIPNALHPAIVSMFEKRSGSEAYPTYFRFNRPSRIEEIFTQSEFESWKIELLEHPDVYGHIPLVSRIERLWHRAAKRWPALSGVILIEATKRSR